eukprot:16002662-Heterocapsa_arctica.AAC.1
MEKIRTEKPQLLIGSPMCTAFSCIQGLNWGRVEPGQKAKLLERARANLYVCFDLHNIQLVAGRYFLHEHPATATSWQDPK